MASILPTTKLPPTRINPKVLLMYGDPKVGKTTLINELESCLLCDIEEGATSIESMRVPLKSILENMPIFKPKLIANTDTWVNDEVGSVKKTVFNEDKQLTSISLEAIFADILQQGQDQVAAGIKKPQFPYKRIAFDTIDKFQDLCEISATVKYKRSVLGKGFFGGSVLELPKGAGHWWLRTEVIERLDQMKSVCETLILVGHTKDSVINKGGVDMTQKGISLTGQLASIIFAYSDFITYLYREPGKKALMATLEPAEGSVMGTRDFPHLRPLIGTRFEFAWDKILVNKPA
jgi:hypothetical protein